MRRTLSLIGFATLLLATGPAFAVSPNAVREPTLADLDALDRLECFPGNPLISESNAFTLLAIVPDPRSFAQSRTNGRFVRLTRLLHGRFVPHDVKHRAPSVDDPEGSPEREVPNVMIVSLRSRGRGRFGSPAELERKFNDEVARLRRLLPDARLSCVYDVERYAEARVKCGAELAP